MLFIFFIDQIYILLTMINNYQVDGGLEDWSYAASWEGSPRPINTCPATTYKRYAIEKTQYDKVDIRTLVYLVETDNSKHPRESTLGE